jgi:hypothetical protein
LGQTTLARPPLRSITAWAKANRASREPFTGITWVAASGSRHAVAARDPGGDRLAQGIRALGGRIVGQAAEVVGQRLLDEGRRLVLRLADRQLDFAKVGAGATPANSWRSFSKG